MRILKVLVWNFFLVFPKQFANLFYGCCTKGQFQTLTRENYNVVRLKLLLVEIESMRNLLLKKESFKLT